jgi:hypothetical protein
LEVVAPDGEPREFPIDLPSLIVGRADGNGIVIDDLSISRRHARLVIESGNLLVEDLGSASGTFIGGHKIEPNSLNLVEGNQAIRFGEIEAHYRPPDASQAQLEEPTPGAEPADQFEDIPSSAIRITVESPLTPVDPGSVVFGTARIHNRGRVVDLVTVSIADVPANWVTLSRQSFAILPGAREDVTIAFQPPVHADSLAGIYDFSVVVTSGEHEREAVAFGKLTVLPFEGTTLALQPLRSKRQFTVVARNGGNALATYVLSGADDEAAFVYDFEVPSIELQPGEERKVPARVKRPKRQLFGRMTIQPFQVIATPTGSTASAVNVTGQLVVKPPLEKWKRPAMFAALIAVACLAAYAYFYWNDDSSSTKTVTAANPEAAYAGVHMCDKSNPPKVTPAAPAGGGSGAPTFAQNNPQWFKVEYARAADPEFGGTDWCGTTIEQCGCAMTSVATIMAIFNIVTMPDGSELTPKTVNDWFNQDAVKTSRGWVSQGYVFGDVIWTSANELSAEIAKTRPGSPTIRFARTGTGSDDEIRSELKAGRPIVLEVPGHWIAAIGLQGDTILINDPYYGNRRTLDAYKGKVKSSVLFEPSNDLSGVAITVPRDLRVRVTDTSGKVVGTLNTGTGDELKASVQTGITGASYSSRDAWRDPTCVESPPKPGDGTTTILLPGNRQDYKIEVLNPAGGGTSVAIHSYDRNGNSALTEQDSQGPLVMAIGYDPAKAAVESQVISTGAPPAGSATTPSGSAGGTGGGTGGGAAVAPPGGAAVPSAPAAATATPRPPTATPTPLPAPQSVVVNCAVAYTDTPRTAGVTCTGAVTGTYTTTRWVVNGVAAPAPAGSTSLAATFTSNATVTIQMAACNVTACNAGTASVKIEFPAAGTTPTPTVASGATATPTPPPTPGSPPAAVVVTCSYTWAGPQARIDCATSFAEAFTDITWNATGGASPASLTTAQKTFTTFLTGGGTTQITATVCFNGNCSTSAPAILTTGAPLIAAVLALDAPVADIGATCLFVVTASVVNWSSGMPVPTGPITLFDGASPVSTVPIGSGEPIAVFTIHLDAPPGVHLLAASYPGDLNWGPGTTTSGTPVVISGIPCV